MTGNARQFSLELDREFAMAMDDVRKAVVRLATEGLAGVQEKSPVDTGQFRANWLVSIGSPDPSSQEGPGPGHASKSAGALASYSAQEGFPVIYLQNNLPYATRLEDGYSKQAPNGMVSLTLAELAAMWNGMKA